MSTGYFLDLSLGLIYPFSFKGVSVVCRIHRKKEFSLYFWIRQGEESINVETILKSAVLCELPWLVVYIKS